MYNEKNVGQAEIIKEGLFYRIHCACKPTDEGIHRITVSDGISVVDLGICVPVGERFVLTTRIPAKRLTGENLSFALVGKNEGEHTVPVDTGAPFAHLDKLENARLEVTNGQKMIVIDPIQDQQGNDQSQEYQNRWEQQ